MVFSIVSRAETTFFSAVCWRPKNAFCTTMPRSSRTAMSGLDKRQAHAIMSVAGKSAHQSLAGPGLIKAFAISISASSMFST